MNLALFDLDGCLVDSNRAITGSLVHALREVGLAGHRPEELTWCVGPPLVESVATLLADAGEDVALVPTVVDRYRDRYQVISTLETEVVAGIPEVLDRLLADGVRLAVVTSKPEAFAVPVLEGVGLRERFEAVHAPVADHQAEPKAVTLRRALDELAPGLDPARSVMIGDRSHDVVAGRACRTRTVGVTWGAGSRDELLGAGADLVVDHPADLATAVEELFGPPHRDRPDRGAADAP